VTAKKLDPAVRRALAKVRVAEHMRDPALGKISDSLANAAAGQLTRGAFPDLEAQGLITWQPYSGYKLTATGEKLLRDSGVVL